MNEKILTLGTPKERKVKDQYVYFKNSLKQNMNTDFKETADFVPNIINMKDILRNLVWNSRPSKTKLKDEMVYTPEELNAMIQNEKDQLDESIYDMFLQETKAFTAHKITIG